MGMASEEGTVEEPQIWDTGSGEPACLLLTWLGAGSAVRVDRLIYRPKSHEGRLKHRADGQTCSVGPVIKHHWVLG